MINFKKFNSVISLTSYFTSDDKCKQAIIEGFWSHFRRMIVGCYHDVSDEHLQHYIDEAVYRWNTRKASQSERFEDMFDKSIGLVRKWSEIKVGLVAA
jgi:hypothetical protein